MYKAGPKSAFTLIELLVVIAIIALLLAIVMPSLRAARMAAMRLISTSNLRQIGIALSLYADDNEGGFPLTTHSTTDRTETWIYTLSPYVSGVDAIRICPADPKGRERLEHNTTSYIVNEYMTPRYRFGRLIAEDSFHNLHRLRRKDRTITVFVAADRWNPADTGADHVHSRSWFLSDIPDDRWAAVHRDIQPDRYRVGNHASDYTRGTTLFLYADARVEVIEAETIKEWTRRDDNFAKPLH